LKRILLPVPVFIVVLPLLPAILLAASGCSRSAAPEARHTATLTEALRPAFFAEALRRAGGGHYHGTARFAAGLATPDDGVTTTTDVWVDRARNFRVSETNDRDGGREVVLAGRQLFVALRYGKMIRRAAEEPEPTKLLEEAVGAPWAAWEIAAPWAAIESAASNTGVTEYRLARAAVRTEDPAARESQKGLRAWRADAVVDRLSGRAVVDDATGALKELELSAAFTAKRDGRDLKGTIDVKGALTDAGATAAVAPPEAEDLALRQRVVPEQRELLGGLPSTRLPPPKAARASGAAPKATTPKAMTPKGQVP
jgi:hypothetical protein